MTPHPPQPEDTVPNNRGAGVASNRTIPDAYVEGEPGNLRLTPNPTEEQTSPRTFKEFALAYVKAHWPDDPNHRSLVRQDFHPNSYAKVAWDARQPEIDRLRGALERIEREAEDRLVWRLGSKLRMGFYVVRDIAREALDG